MVVRSGGNDLAFNGLRALATRQVSVTFPRWWVAAELSGRSGDVALELAMEADPATFVGLRYLHPKGGTSCCYNSKFASVRLTLRGPDGVATARSHLGELEILSRQPVPGLALHGNAAPLALDRRPRPAAGSRAHASPQPETRA
ncbi:MAG: hypothetical protein U1F43_36325 [Myxococcota bacterium]